MHNTNNCLRLIEIEITIGFSYNKGHWLDTKDIKQPITNLQLASESTVVPARKLGFPNQVHDWGALTKIIMSHYYSLTD